MIGWGVVIAFVCVLLAFGVGYWRGLRAGCQLSDDATARAGLVQQRADRLEVKNQQLRANERAYLEDKWDRSPG